MNSFTFTPLGQTSGGGVAETLEDQYMILRRKCLDNYGQDFCNSVLPRSMVYAVTRRGQGYTLPWWLWMGLGALAMRLIR